MNRTLWLFLALLAACGGCEEYQETDTSAFPAQKTDYLLVFAIDMSHPFRQRILDKTGAYQFFLDTSANFFRDRVGSDDEIIIAQLSAGDNTPLWQGPPLDLKRRFRNADELSDFLAGHSKSEVGTFAGLANTLDYVMQLPGVRERQTRVLVIVLSTMCDDSKRDRKKLVAALKEFSCARGEIGYYWVETKAIKALQQMMQEAGLPTPYFKPIPLDHVDGLQFD